jgi:outer membrane protein TolC
MNAMSRLLATGAVASALLTGCAHPPVGPDYVPPAPLAFAQPASAGTFRSAGGNAADTALPPHWWRLYDDRQLDALVTQALEHNTDLRQAVANLEHVQALATEVHGNERPTVAASGGPSFGHVSGLSLLQRDDERTSDRSAEERHDQ